LESAINADGHKLALRQLAELRSDLVHNPNGGRSQRPQGDCEQTKSNHANQDAAHHSLRVFPLLG